MADSEEFDSFEDALSEDDYGIIISSAGELKGIFIPQEVEDRNDNIPESVVKLIINALGVNIADMLDNEDDANSKTAN